MAQVKDYRYNGTEGGMVTVKVGDYVSFKSDVEQGGKIIAINGNRLTLENAHGFEGHYIGGSTVTTELASDCWAE